MEISNRDLLQVETSVCILIDSSFDIPFIGTRHQLFNKLYVYVSSAVT